MPLQQIFSPGNNANRSRGKGLSNNNGTNQVDKVFAQEEKDTAGEYTPSLLKRSSSMTSNNSSTADMCRICHSEGDADALLISPCHCTGSLKCVHQKCLQRWIKSSQAKTCELCKYEFQMESKTKPFNKWEKLDMSAVERRKILCSVTFHVIAITCVIWSLYVLIDRTTEEIARGELEWPFWTKLIVVAIGFTGGVVFMYVQCKMYVQLCRRWKTYNRVIFIQTCQRDNAGGGGGTGLKAGGTATGTEENAAVIFVEDRPETFHTPDGSPHVTDRLLPNHSDNSNNARPTSITTIQME